VGYSYNLMPLMNSLKPKDYENERKWYKNVFGLFMVDQKQLDKNLWMLTQRSKGGLDMKRVEYLPFWRYQQFVNIANEIAEEEKKEREKQEEQQKQQQQSSQYNPSSYLNQMSSMANKFKM
jgi:hypothetical protein